ncbi:MAG: DUF3465 domain-containing protein [Gemmatimonadota bacterium]|nr:DUF3465 domain-containing protein [Gemmatimonadota bacterium]
MAHRAEGSDARRLMRAAVLVVLAVLLVAGRNWLSDSAILGGAATESGEQQVLELFEGRRSGAVVLVGGVVEALLPDDNDGSRHQRFIVQLPSGHTLLVAHNIDLAPRVPLRDGDAVQVRGEYEWNQQGGVLHWTHDDPDGDHPGGWIELDGDRYR